MMPIPSGVQVWLTTGHTDMRRGFDGLALLVQETLKRNPHNGHLFRSKSHRPVEAGALTEVVAELTLENRLLKNSVTADGEDAA